MKRVHIVMADYAYEGSNIVRVFESAGGAGLFVLKCRAHGEKRPESPPPIENTPENDAAHEAWYQKMQAWEKRHPAKPHTGADSYSVSVWKVTLSSFHVSEGK